MKLYLVRHGQSVLNAKEVHQDAFVELSEHGIGQSAVLAKRFMSISVDVVMASPFERAQQTAQIIAKRLDKPVQTNPLLFEVKRPSAIVGRRIDEPEVIEIKERIEANAHDASWRHSDEETFYDVKERAKMFLRQLDLRSEENVLVVTHGHFIKVIVCVMMHGDDLTPELLRAFIKTFAIQNTGMTACMREPGAHWRVLQWNDDAHLGELT
jgi:broad specificity phosphatase PhoE